MRDMDLRSYLNGLEVVASAGILCPGLGNSESSARRSEMQVCGDRAPKVGVLCLLHSKQTSNPFLPLSYTLACSLALHDASNDFDIDTIFFLHHLEVKLLFPTSS